MLNEAKANAASPVLVRRMIPSRSTNYGAKRCLGHICPANAGCWQAGGRCGKTSPVAGAALATQDPDPLLHSVPGASGGVPDMKDFDGIAGNAVEYFVSVAPNHLHPHIQIVGPLRRLRSLRDESNSSVNCCQNIDSATRTSFVEIYVNPTDIQGNRVKNSCCDEACEEVVIPSGDFAAEAEGILAWGSSDQVEGHMLDGGEVGGCVIGADAAFVVAEIHVHDPVKAVFDHPMGSDRRPELGGDPQ